MMTPAFLDREFADAGVARHQDHVTARPEVAAGVGEQDEIAAVGHVLAGDLAQLAELGRIGHREAGTARRVDELELGLAVEEGRGALGVGDAVAQVEHVVGGGEPERLDADAGVVDRRLVRGGGAAGEQHREAKSADLPAAAHLTFTLTVALLDHRPPVSCTRYLKFSDPRKLSRGV
jgi:hypothetical protein